MRRRYAPYSVTCGIFGLMAHTAFAEEANAASLLYETMRDRLTEILALPAGEEEAVFAAHRKFVDDF